MRKSVFFLLFVSLASVGKAQEITIYKTFGGLRFERDSLILSPKQVQYVLEVNPAALAEFKKARKNSGVASVLGFAGGLLIGIPIGSALVGGDPEWGLAAAGATLVVASIPFNGAFKRHAQNAVDIYNQEKTSRLLERTELFWAATGLGIRLRL
jgi:hypothetical protein